MTNEKTRQVLSTLWIFFMLNLVFRDIHEIGTAAFLNEALTGKINGAVITEELMLLGFVLIEIPLAMIIGSLFLPHKMCRWLTIVAAVLTGAILSLGLPGDLDDRAFAIVEFITLGYICWLAWRLPSLEKH
ncbi:DUF6326 family protein [uncultured Maritalea sp.]|jgi:hypothetical protein|uniref:DUF6326 family protein n=1 Tax=uncultured Maritalea sp. TaxID=757249 RepID=UPI0026128FCD|nr:DUF6326 family protein [uncultured Maritalea sp.]